MADCNDPEVTVLLNSLNTAYKMRHWKHSGYLYLQFDANAFRPLCSICLSATLHSAPCYVVNVGLHAGIE